MKERVSAYTTARVDAEAGGRAVELIKAAAGHTFSVDVVGGVGDSARMVDVSVLKGLQRPLLVTSTDGVGTKITIAHALDVHDTTGQDLVGTVVDNTVMVGMHPFLVIGYITCGRVDPERIADVMRSVTRVRELVGIPLLGGGTTEYLDLMTPDDHDVAGAATGVVEASEALGPEHIEVSDAILTITSSGLHSSGYSPMCRIVAESGQPLGHDAPESGWTPGEELLEPTRPYSPLCLEVSGRVHIFSYVTGGGLAVSLARVVPARMHTSIDCSSIGVPPVFSIVYELGGAAWEDPKNTLNVGVGMVAVLAEEEVDAVVASSAARGCAAWPIGVVSKDVDAG